MQEQKATPELQALLVLMDRAALLALKVQLALKGLSDRLAPPDPWAQPGYRVKLALLALRVQPALKD